MNNFNILQPVRLSYLQLSAEELTSTTRTLNTGLSVISYDILNDVKDVNLNNNTCLVLTNKHDIGDIFITKNSQTQLGSIPVDVTIQPSHLQSAYIALNTKEKTFICSSEPTTFNIARVTDTSNLVTIMYGSNYVCIDDVYPYTVRLKNVSEILYINTSRYYFTIDKVGKFYTFKIVLENNALHYLCIGKDHNVTATGLFLGEVYNSFYTFQVNIKSTESITFDPVVSNKWVTYYMNVDDRDHNLDVEINKTLKTQNNYLVSFTVGDALDTRSPAINIATLKTNFTPTGIGTSINNLLVDESSVLNLIRDHNASILTPNGLMTFASNTIHTSN